MILSLASGAPCHPIAYDGASHTPGGRSERGVQPLLHAQLQSPTRVFRRLCLVCMALTVCRLRVGAWSLGCHPSTPSGDSCLGGRGGPETDEALFHLGPRGLEGGSSELPRGCACTPSCCGRGRLTSGQGRCRGGRAQRSPMCTSLGSLEGFRVEAADWSCTGSWKRTRQSEALRCERGGERPMSGGLPILFFQKHPHLLLFALELSVHSPPKLFPLGP